MKLKLTFLAVIVAVVAAFSFVVQGVYVGHASEKVTVIVKDDFDNVEYADSVNSDKWYKSDDADSTIGQSSAGGGGSTLLFKSEATGDNVIAYLKKTYPMTSVSFDMKFGVDAAAWAGIGLKENASGTNLPSIYKAPVLITTTAFSPNAGWSAQGTYSSDLGVALGESSGTKYEDVWLTFKYDFTAEDTFDFYVKHQTDDDFGAKVATFKYNFQGGESVRDVRGYNLCFGVAGGTACEFDNVVITTSDVVNPTVIEDFESAQTDVVIANKTASSVIYALILRQCPLSFVNSPKDARVVAKTQIDQDGSILTDYVVVKCIFDVKINSGKIKLLFGLQSISASPDTKNVYAYEISATGGKLLKYGDNGTFTEEGSNDFANVGGEDGSHIAVLINKNGNMIVKENEHVVNGAGFTMPSYVGYTGIASAENDTDAEIDNVEIISSTYKVPVTKSLTNNFSTDYIGGEYTRDYFMTSTPSDTLFIQNGKLVFNGCSDRTFFGTCYEYDDFVMDYKISNIYSNLNGEDRASTGAGRWLGLDIGRNNYDIAYYGTYLMLYFNIVPANNQTTTAIASYVSSGVERPENLNIYMHENIPMSLFTDITYDGEEVQKTQIKDGDAVCVRWVSENNVLKLYLKKAREIEFTLYATISGIEMTGYQALCCTGFTYLEIDDFSMANMSKVYECASNDAPETLVIEVEAPYDYNKYIDSGTLKEELNYLDNAKGGGCESSVSGSELAVLTAMLMVPAITIFSIKRRKNENEQDKY